MTQISLIVKELIEYSESFLKTLETFKTTALPNGEEINGVGLSQKLLDLFARPFYEKLHFSILGGEHYNDSLSLELGKLNLLVAKINSTSDQIASANADKADYEKFILETK